MHAKIPRKDREIREIKYRELLPGNYFPGIIFFGVGDKTITGSRRAARRLISRLGTKCVVGVGGVPAGGRLGLDDVTPKGRVDAGLFGLRGRAYPRQEKAAELLHYL